MPWGFFRIPDFQQPITFFSSVPFGSILQKKNGSSNSLPCCLAGGSFQPYPPLKDIQKKMATVYPTPRNWIKIDSHLLG